MDESKKKDRYEDAKKFVRYSDGAKMYSMGMTKFQEVAKDAKACYKIGQLVLVNGISKSRIIVIAREAGAVYKVGNSALINTELFEKYLERFREPARELPKHTWNKLKEMTNTPKTGENS